MAFCSNCGQRIDDRAVICPHCGVPQQNNLPMNRSGSNDSGGFGWALLGFCIPVVGLILYLVWKDDKPRSSSAAGKGALVSVIVGAVFLVLYFIAVFALLASIV